MKKCIFAILCLLIMTSSICAASIAKSDLAVGGITLFNRMPYVESIYGEPSRTSSKDLKIWGGTVRFYTYFYGDESFYLLTTERDGVLDVIVKANNGITTSAGIAVGMNQNALLETYGSPDSTENKPDGTIKYIYRENKTGPGIRDELSFNLRNNEIVQISLTAGILYL